MARWLRLRDRRVTVTYTGSPVDRRTVDRSAVSFRAAAAVPCLRIRLAARRPVLRLASGGPVAAAAESVATVTESAPAEGPVVLLQARDARQLSE